MLYTQAQDKTYRDETDDSLISIAVDYYRNTDDVHRKFLSYYYKGRVHFNSKDYLNATTCYMEAEQLVDEVVYACRTLNKKVVGGGQAMFSTGMLRLSFGDKILGW